MKHYIDKDVLLERIKKLKMDIGNILNEYDEGFWEGRTTAFDDVICALNTLEVKEVNLENSMVCKVDWYDGFFLDYTQEQQDTLLEKIGATYEDKIRVILIKE